MAFVRLTFIVELIMECFLYSLIHFNVAVDTRLIQHKKRQTQLYLCSFFRKGILVPEVFLEIFLRERESEPSSSFAEKNLTSESRISFLCEKARAIPRQKVFLHYAFCIQFTRKGFHLSLALGSS